MCDDCLVTIIGVLDIKNLGGELRINDQGEAFFHFLYDISDPVQIDQCGYVIGDLNPDWWETEVELPVFDGATQAVGVFSYILHHCCPK